jgi:UPF0271 protein
MIHDPDLAARVLVGFLSSGLMPTVDAAPIGLVAHSICAHGDSPGAVAMARHVRQAIAAAGFGIRPFLEDAAFARATP